VIEEGSTLLPSSLGSKSSPDANRTAEAISAPCTPNIAASGGHIRPPGSVRAAPPQPHAARREPVTKRRRYDTSVFPDILATFAFTAVFAFSLLAPVFDALRFALYCSARSPA
jgi:hypothetical protein